MASEPRKKKRAAAAPPPAATVVRTVGRERDRAARREARVAGLEAQLAVWGKTLNDHLARLRHAGPGRDGAESTVRIDGLKARHAALRARVVRYDTFGGQTWGSFQAEIAGDWQTLELAIADLPPVEPVGRPAPSRSVPGSAPGPAPATRSVPSTNSVPSK